MNPRMIDEVLIATERQATCLVDSVAARSINLKKRAGFQLHAYLPIKVHLFLRYIPTPK